MDVGTDETLTHHDVLHDRQQHHLLKDVFHQDETRKVLKDQLLETRKLLWGTDRVQFSMLTNSNNNNNTTLNVQLFYCFDWKAWHVMTIITTINCWPGSVAARGRTQRTSSRVRVSPRHRKGWAASACRGWRSGGGPPGKNASSRCCCHSQISRQRQNQEEVTLKPPECF